MRERVSVVRGKLPVLLVAPHGADHPFTAIMAESVAARADCNAVVNNGFDFSPTVDVDRNRADCNRCDHVKQPVVFDEYLKPIQKITDRLILKMEKSFLWTEADDTACLVLHLLPCGDDVHGEAGEDVAVVVGYGLGQKMDSLTCRMWRRHAFVDLFRYNIDEGEVYDGEGGGSYAGRAADHMNQYFRKHMPDQSIDSMQLCFPTPRSPAALASAIESLSATVVEMAAADDYGHKPKTKFI